jgi:hypothetical protein
MILNVQVTPAADLSSGYVTVLTYTNVTGRDLAVLARAELGSDAQPVAGSGLYGLRATINGHVMFPDSLIPIGAEPKAGVQSRLLTVRIDETIIVQVQGLPADTAVDVTAILMDATPALLSELIGEGPIPVDHNYGGADNLRVLDPGGAAIQGASITAYLSAEYDAGNRGSSFIRGRSSTDANGRWRSAMSLFPADYTLITVKPGYTLPTTTLLTVS